MHYIIEISSPKKGRKKKKYKMTRTNDTRVISRVVALLKAFFGKGYFVLLMPHEKENEGKKQKRNR